MDYGFASWAALKHHVESLRGRPTVGPAAVRTSDGAVMINGFQRASWGGATGRQISVVAVFALVSEAFGDDADYDFLMGASGAAFRVQMSIGQLCPSSPHANCGLECRSRAIRAWGRDVTSIDTSDKQAPARDEARRRVVESIDRGIPVIADAEECSLIVGYSAEGLIVRKYSARREGYEPLDGWPWSIGVVAAERRPPEPAQLVVDSLRTAIDWWNTTACDGYACGAHAYEHWIEQLRDDAAFAAMEPDKLFSSALGNAFMFDALADARGAAANYLAAVADTMADSGASACARAASAEYAQLERLLRENRSLAPYPWELAQTTDWSLGMRHRQAAFQESLRAGDAAAVASVGELLASLMTRR